ncbi:MAG: hypothetical protein AAFY80_07045 [Pseudomonadota bacterium]
MSEGDSDDPNVGKSSSHGRTRGFSQSTGESYSVSRSETFSFDDRDRKAFSELVSLAEKVQTQRDVLRRQMQFSLGAGLFIMLAAMAVFTTLVFDRSAPSDATISGFLLTTPAGAMTIVFAVASYVGTTLVFMQMSRRLRRENRAFAEVMNVVHEVFEGLKEELSPLELAETRIRLSRLDN